MTNILNKIFGGKNREEVDVPNVSDATLYSRRDILKRMVAATVALGGSAVVSPEAFADSSPSPEDNHEAENLEHGEAKLTNAGKLIDMTTASLIVFEFIRSVVLNNLVKDGGKVKNLQEELGMPISLGTESAVEFLTLELSRIFLLKLFGGEAGVHLAEHEMAELQGGLIPIPILVLLSDITTTYLQVDVNEIFNEESKKFLEGSEIETLKRPDINASIEEWEKFYENSKNRLIEVTSKEIGGVTTVLAPFGSTYGSSGVANVLKQNVPELLLESFLAESVIAKKRNNEQKLNAAELQQAAIKKANNGMNGFLGYNKLLLTLAANAQGG